MVNDVNTKHVKPILETIAKNAIFCFKDIFVYYKGCSRATAYNHNLDKLDTIKEALDDNKRRAVSSMLARWIKSDNATLQIAAMRIISDEDERRRLNQSYVDHTTGGERFNMNIIVDNETKP